MCSPRAHPYSYLQFTYYSTASVGSIPAGGIRLSMPNVARLQAVLARVAEAGLPLETA